MHKRCIDLGLVRGICETILLIDWLIRKMTRWVRGICETIMLIDWLFREMTRWVRGICEAIRPLETLDVEGLVRLWAHEALRLFQEWNLNKLYKTVDTDFFLSGSWVFRNTKEKNIGDNKTFHFIKATTLKGSICQLCVLLQSALLSTENTHLFLNFSK